MPAAILVVLLVLFVALGVLFLRLSIPPRPEKWEEWIKEWAQEKGLKLLSHDQVGAKSVYFWPDFKKVYRVTVRDTENRLRRGYVDCRMHPKSPGSERVDVRWDD